jgi:hypothetical protein
MEQSSKTLLFRTGDLIISDEFEALGLDHLPFLIRHFRGDWDHMPLSDRASNNHALEFGEEILSTFPFGEGDQQVGVMTESDRSYTFIFILDPTTQNVA